jgi:hypothetical protein
MLLTELYLQDKDSLLQEMQNESTIAGLIGVINKYLSKITDLNGSYISGLTRPQARIALSIIGIHKEYFRKLTDYIDHLSRSVSEQPDETYSSHPQTKNPYRIPDNNALAGIGVSTLIAAFLTNPLVAIPAASLAGLAATVFLGTKHPTSSPSLNENQVSVTQSHHSQLDCSIFLSNIEQLFRTVDEILDEHSRLIEEARPQPMVPKLEDHARILEFIQDLLGWYQRKKGEMTDVIGNALEVRFEEQLPDLFSEYGIQVRYYSTEAGDRDLRLFDFEDEVGESRLTMPLMVRPALLKAGDVLLRGRVIEPRLVNTVLNDHQS